MNLSYAVERLINAGWTPDMEMDLEQLPDGRSYPSVLAVQREFAQAGLELSIKQNLMFGCYRATWSPAGDAVESSAYSEVQQGTVIGACPREAAVYALAQLRTAQAEHLAAAF